MAQQPSPTFSNASDGADLIPGNQRGVTAINDALGTGAASVADTSAALARTANSLSWSGPAADAFAEHRRTVIDTTDHWDQAVDTVRTTLDDHLTALSAAQNSAADALDLWHTAQRQLHVAQHADTPDASLASNAAAVRAQALAAGRATAQRARTLLSTARENLDQSGDRAAENVRAALDALRAAPLPRLGLDAHSATAGPVATASGSPWTPPGWSGPTVTVQPPLDGVHDSLSRIAQRVLGDANRWPEIYQLNLGQPVGPHAVLTDPSMIQPGWVLRLPSSATLAPTTPAPVVPMPVAPPVTPGPVIHHPSAVLPHADTPAPQHLSGLAPIGAAPTGGIPAAPSPGTTSTAPAVPPPISTVGPLDTSPPGTAVPVVPTTIPPATPVPQLGHTPPTPLPPARSSGSLSTTSNDHGIDAGGGLILAGGVVAALVGVGAVVGIHHHRTRGTGTPVEASMSADGADQDAPVIRRLSVALPPSGNGASADYQDDHRGPQGPTGPDLPWVGEVGGAGSAHLPFGQRDGKTVLYDVAATLGLGLAGPGALNTARALLLSALSAHPDARVVLSGYDRRRLLDTVGHTALGLASPDTGPAAPPLAPRDRRVRVEPSLDAVLNTVEADMVTRVRVLEDHRGQITMPPLVVITTIPDDTRRLQMIADLGAGLGVVVIVLGSWPAGITCYVARDGRVTEARGTGAEAWDLDGLILFSAGQRDTRDLLNILTRVPAHRPARTPIRQPRNGRGSNGRSSVLPARHTPTTPGTLQFPNEATTSTPIDSEAAELAAADDPAFEGMLYSGDEVARRLNPDRHPEAPHHGDISRRLDPDPDPVAPPDHVTAAAERADPASEDDVAADTGTDTGTGHRHADVVDDAAPPADTTADADRQVPQPRRAHRGEQPATSVTPHSPVAPATTAPRATSTAKDHDAPVASAPPATVARFTGTPVLTLQILGDLRLLFHPTTDTSQNSDRRSAISHSEDITEVLGPRLRELLMFIGLHEQGVRRDEVVDALWPHTNPMRHTHSLNTTTSRLRRALARGTGDTVRELIRHTDNRLQLDGRLVSVDLWQFSAAWDAARSATAGPEREAAYRRMIDAYHGQFGNDVDADWVAAPRQSLHRAATDAISGLARMMVDVDPQQTLDLLDSARNWDPFNEHLYRDIMRLQAKLGQVDAIGRTLELLRVRLADIDVEPSSETRALAAGLEQRAGHTGDPTPTASSASRPPATATSRPADHPRPASP